jgi:hypothetical protein
MFFNCRHPSHTTTNQISAISAHVKQQHHHDDARSSCLQFFLRKNGFDMCCTRRLKFHARNHGWICSVAAAVVVVVEIIVGQIDWQTLWYSSHKKKHMGL